MKRLNAFVHSRPYWACILTAVVVSMFWIDFIAWLAFGFGPDLIWYPLFAVMAGACIWLDRRLVSAVVIGALLCACDPVKAAEPEPLPLVVIGGIVIIVGGGTIIGCRAYRKCSKISKARTNAWPEELNFVVAGDPSEYAANFSWGEDTFCYEERLLPQVPVSFVLDIVAASASNTTVSVSANVGEHYVQTWAELEGELAGLGLSFPDSPQPSSSFSRNRHPVHAEQVPITFNFRTQTATVGGGGVEVNIERSTDMEEWERFLRVNVEAGARLQVSDAYAEGQQFYRVTTR